MKKRQRFIRHAMATAMRKGSYQKNFASPNENFYLCHRIQRDVESQTSVYDKIPKTVVNGILCGTLLSGEDIIQTTALC